MPLSGTASALLFRTLVEKGWVRQRNKQRDSRHRDTSQSGGQELRRQSENTKSKFTELGAQPPSLAQLRGSLFISQVRYRRRLQIDSTVKSTSMKPYLCLTFKCEPQLRSLEVQGKPLMWKRPKQAIQPTLMKRTSEETDNKITRK